MDTDFLCVKCGAPYHPWSKWVEQKVEKGHVILCRNCWDLVYGMGGPSKLPGAWRGKGSFGKNPGQAAGDNIIEDIIGKIEDWETES